MGATDERVTLTIDGQAISVAKGTTVLQAALTHGIHLPFFCYHPALSIEGSCRACLVKIERMPKLQTACSTACSAGMVVSTTSPEAVEARAGVLEFLLLNHPLDCPVCDKGGECPRKRNSRCPRSACCQRWRVAPSPRT